MNYACLVYVDESMLHELPADEEARFRRETAACEEELRRSGYLVSSTRLSPARNTVTLRVRDGRMTADDGPGRPAARRELTDILVVEARDLNDALRVASRHPLGRIGVIRVRPVARRDDSDGNGFPDRG
ncbi:MAG: YciI family protein [Gemmatimonadota bacterium]